MKHWLIPLRMRSLLLLRILVSGLILLAVGLHLPIAQATALSRSTLQNIEDGVGTIASLPKEFTLYGTRLLLVGNTPMPAASLTIEVREMGTKDVYASHTVTSDERAAFAEIWEIPALCGDSLLEKEYELLMDGEVEHAFAVRCDTSDSFFPFERMLFAGQALSFDAASPYVIAEGKDAVFEAVGQPWMQVYAAYASIVMSKDIYVGNQGRIRIAPWQTLLPGKHHLYIAPYDPIRKTLYDPLMIPFSVQGGVGEQLKATVYYAPGAAAILLLVFFGSVIYIRRARSMRRGIILVGEEYPDEFPEYNDR